MRISLLRISLLRFFKTITKILLIRFYGLFILLVRSLAKDLANAILWDMGLSKVQGSTEGRFLRLGQTYQ